MLRAALFRNNTPRGWRGRGGSLSGELFHVAADRLIAGAVGAHHRHVILQQQRGSRESAGPRQPRSQQTNSLQAHLGAWLQAREDASYGVAREEEWRAGGTPCLPHGEVVLQASQEMQAVEISATPWVCPQPPAAVTCTPWSHAQLLHCSRTTTGRRTLTNGQLFGLGSAVAEPEKGPLALADARLNSCGLQQKP